MAKSQVGVFLEADDRGTLQAEAAARGWSLSTMCARVLAGYCRSKDTRREQLVKLGILAEAEQRVAP